ncbi:hypothetical protein [Stutzerimonas stutzeri]|uniref:hypothetical protein n=1 Tax=Stutzerimonas stutzeri TaxID=316 RepID=UPI0039B6FC5F
MGAAEDGRVTGIAPNALAQMRKDLANTSRVCFSHHLRKASTQSSPHVARRRSVVMDCLSEFYPPCAGAA